MNKHLNITKAWIVVSASIMLAAAAHADVIAHYPMELTGQGTLVDEKTGTACTAFSKFGLEQVGGARGGALRFDGSSTYLTTVSPDLSSNVMTVSVWCAVETYPMMNTSEAQNVKSLLVGNLDSNLKNGFNFTLSSQGDWGFNCYTGGWAVALDAPAKLPTYRWCHLVAVIDGTNKKLTLYLNGEQVAQTRCMNTIDHGTSTLRIGKPADDLKCSGYWNINTFNGVIDDIDIYNTALTADEVAALYLPAADHEVDMTIPATRFADHIWRPAFHGMPGANWTNECHGLVYYDGRYHLFFQKNANGAYMARLHWGHLSSADLIHWREEPIALAPDRSYDLKGCWSGCVFTDEVLTQGRPDIFYTAVDNGKATICQASAADDALLTWTKSSQNPRINGRPAGLSDDFRDPYVFAANGTYYMIVGTSKDDKGATTLHRYNATTKTWSNDGSIFFAAANKSVSGRFWEMPTVNKIGDRWLFTATPLETSQGVEVQYWVGDIQADGTFRTSQTAPLKVELEGFGKEGFGLLSPSITEVDGKTIAMGIVPDKLSTQTNFDMGWAHNYSLPREWSLDDQGQLIQKPYAGLQAMRSEIAYASGAFTLSDAMPMGSVTGRMVEAVGEFTVGADPFGFRFFEKEGRGMEIYFNPATQMMTIDMTAMPRTANDGGTFSGLYQSGLPRTITPGETMKIHAFIDHSILDLFIDDRWAASIRMFPTDRDATGVQVFSKGTTEVKSLRAWVLDKTLVSSIGGIDSASDPVSIYGDSTGAIVYDHARIGSLLQVIGLDGRIVWADRLTATSGQVRIPGAKGLYIVQTDGRSSHKIIL